MVTINANIQMNKQTDFEIELEKINKDISELEEIAFATPVDCEKLIRFVYRLYQRASLTGSFSELEAAENAIDKAILQLRQPADLYLLKVNIDFKFHRLANVKNRLETNSDLKDSLPGRALHADLCFQEGRYEEAKKEYENLISDEAAWDNLARFAHFKFKMGDCGGAEQLYAEAVDELTAKEMRHFAWLELQRGLIDLAQGRFDEAEAHYKLAEKAYSGYWMIEEHTAELLAAQGKFDEALALYHKVVDKVPRPELYQSLGELYDFTGKPEQAQTWYAKAHSAYLESVECGEVHYYHHLVDFYTDIVRDNAKAVDAARKDIALRNNFATQAALAWALYCDNQISEAAELMKRSLSSGVKDAHLFSQAAKIFQAAGENGKSVEYSQMAAALNPHRRHFHVHR